MICKVRMNWSTEQHSFELKTGGSKLETIDFLNDFMNSLDALHKMITEEYPYYPDIPQVFKVKGWAGECEIKAEEY